MAGLMCSLYVPTLLIRKGPSPAIDEPTRGRPRGPANAACLYVEKWRARNDSNVRPSDRNFVAAFAVAFRKPPSAFIGRSFKPPFFACSFLALPCVAVRVIAR